MPRQFPTNRAGPAKRMQSRLLPSGDVSWAWMFFIPDWEKKIMKTLKGLPSGRAKGTVNLCTAHSPLETWEQFLLEMGMKNELGGLPLVLICALCKANCTAMA